MRRHWHVGPALAFALATALVCATTGHARADAPDSPVQLRAPSVLNWIVAGALTSVTAFTITSAVYTAVRSGACVGDTDASGRCNERVDFGMRSGVFLSIGLASLLAATFFAVLQPIRIGVSASPSHATLELEARF